MSMKHQQVLMVSQGKILGFHPHRSLRIIERQSQKQGYTHLQRRGATYARKSQQQRDCHLQQGRAAYEVKRDLIAEVETLALLDQTEGLPMYLFAVHTTNAGKITSKLHVIELGAHLGMPKKFPKQQGKPVAKFRTRIIKLGPAKFSRCK
ncbi:hypothetical protein C5167_045972, partial [Papaver somniferum]